MCLAQITFGSNWLNSFHFFPSEKTEKTFLNSNSKRKEEIFYVIIMIVHSLFFLLYTLSSTSIIHFQVKWTEILPLKLATKYPKINPVLDWIFFSSIISRIKPMSLPTLLHNPNLLIQSENGPILLLRYIGLINLW